MMAAGPVFAAPVEEPGAVQQSRNRQAPEFPVQPQYEFSIEAPHRSPVPRAVDEIHFKLNDIRVHGAVTLSPESFRPFYQNLIGKDVTLSDIYDVADRIEDAYRKAGYPLTRAYVPPQRVSDGVFTIDVVEGYVASVSVEDGDTTAHNRVEDYLQPVIGEKPLHLDTLERALLLSNDLPGVTATGVLRPSPNTPGASDLAVTVSQPRFSGGLAIDNRGSKLTDRWTATADVAINSLFGDADQLLGSFASSPDSFQRYVGQVRYRRPIGDGGLIGSLAGTIAHGEPGSFLSLFNIVTDSWAVGPRLSYPVIRTRAETLVIDGGFTFQDARVDILSTPFSHDQWRVADVGLSYIRNDVLGGIWSAGVDLSQGLPIFGATSDHSPMLSRVGGTTAFTKLTGALHFTTRLAGPLSLALDGQGQYSFNPLISGEQIIFGGTQIGRGYDPGAITGDDGLGGSVELRYTARLPQYAIEALQPYVFFDTAKVWNIHEGGLFDFSIASTGGGLRFWFPYNIAADVELARTLDAVPGSDNGHRVTKVLFNAAVRF
jgi:hemolysin activation/secretion protein